MARNSSLQFGILSNYIDKTHQGSFKPILLTCKVLTSVSNQVIPRQHPSNIICHIILYNNKTLK
jgi:hypothetical protein